MKLFHLGDDGSAPHDAPHTGARLETDEELIDFVEWLDAPHTGARLETPAAAPPCTDGRMPPTRGHDLKPD